MADQGRWFKLWCDSDDDDVLDALDVADFGRWCKLGIHVKKHGTEGSVTLIPPARTLCAKFQVPDFDSLIACISRFPHVDLRRAESVTGVTNATVTFRNWMKYQGDMSADRTRRWRQRVTIQEERRGEEKRGDPPLPPAEDRAKFLRTMAAMRQRNPDAYEHALSRWSSEERALLETELSKEPSTTH